MSRLGKVPITIPQGVEVKTGDGHLIAKGPKGEVKVLVPRQVTVSQEGNVINVTIANTKNSEAKAFWGLTRQLIAGAVKGVTEGFVKKLEINGVGFKVALEGKNLVFNIGFSHQVRYAVPATITATVEKNVITISGADKQQVGQVAAEIRSLKKPEPYKGKGIKYADEVIRRKAGKAAKAAGAK